MNRRGFFGKLAAVAAVGAVVAPVKADERPDVFDRNGWRVQWHGWQRPVNQRIEIGYWSAHRVGDDSGDYVYCTTMGVCDEAGRYYAINTSSTREWPPLDGTHSPRTAELVKRAALARLLERLG